MNVLIVKLSSLGDVVHAMPAVQDLRRARPEARIDWVVEPAFAPLVARCDGVRRVVGCALRQWSRAPLARPTRSAWRAFREQLREQAYDAVIDLQGLTKSALVAHAARLAPQGRRYALANRTEGSGWEAPTRWVADVAVPVAARTPAVLRSRLLCAQALGYGLPDSEAYGLFGQAQTAYSATESEAKPAAPGAEVALVHGSSRADKLWPEPHWLALGQRLLAQGWRIGLPHGGGAEEARARRIAQALGPGAQVWPALDLGRLADRLAGCAGVIGVDSGLSHIAVALGLPHVQIYNFPTAWRTGPLGQPHQRSVYAEPTPTPEAVWQTWEAVRAA